MPVWARAMRLVHLMLGFLYYSLGMCISLSGVPVLCICACACVGMCVCACACVRACMRARVRLCVCECVLFTICVNMLEYCLIIWAKPHAINHVSHVERLTRPWGSVQHRMPSIVWTKAAANFPLRTCAELYAFNHMCEGCSKLPLEDLCKFVCLQSHVWRLEQTSSWGLVRICMPSITCVKAAASSPLRICAKCYAFNHMCQGCSKLALENLCKMLCL